MEVNEKTRLRVSADLRPEIADALRLARKALGYTQTELAQVLGASQGAITRWERAIDSPPISAITVMASLVPDEQKPFWAKAGALSPAAEPQATDMRLIPVLRDAAAAGMARVVTEGEYEGQIAVPKTWFVGAGRLCAVPVKGTSMEPAIFHGSRVVVDMKERTLADQVGWLVLARVEDGVTVKLLQRSGEDYLLVPLNPTVENVASVLSREWGGIVGRVVHILNAPAAWMGPATSKKLKSA